RARSSLPRVSTRSSRFNSVGRAIRVQSSRRVARGSIGRPRFASRKGSGMLRGRMTNTSPNEPHPQLSAGVPPYNQGESLPVLVAELRAALEATGRTWEMVLVDDGSSDGTADRMRAAALSEPRIRVLRLEQNAGQSAALAAGLAAARGAVVVTMDADLQN